MEKGKKPRIIAISPPFGRGSARKPRIIVVVGPTASGKSDLGIRLAKRVGGEVISADSRQVYTGMDIGTGKIYKKEQKTIPHHLIDIVSPKKQFTADHFKRLGVKAIEKILDKNKIPIVVGGTGFYVDVLLGRMEISSVPFDKKLRAQFNKLTTEKLFEKLSKLDPQRVKTIDRHNKRRLIRSLEIVMTTGKPVPKLKPDSKYQVLWLGLKPTNLEHRIKTRLDNRLKQGMVKEVEKLHRQGLSWKRLDNFGLEYKYVSRHLRGLLTKEEMKSQLFSEIKKYSRRQMTWFKRNNEINWVPNTKAAEKLAQKFMS